jgi:hypothetical protein
VLLEAALPAGLRVTFLPDEHEQPSLPRSFARALKRTAPKRSPSQVKNKLLVETVGHVDEVWSSRLRSNLEYEKRSDLWG